MNAGRGGSFFSNMFGGGGESDNGNGGQGSGDQNNQNQNNQNNAGGNQQGQLDQNQLDHNDEVDPAKLLSGFFSEDSDDDEGGEGGEEESNRGQGGGDNNQPKRDADGNVIPSDAERKVMEGIQNIMKSLRPPEDMIPEDFNPSDPKQLRDILGKTQQQTAQATLQMMLIPMQEAMTQMATDLKADFAKQLGEFGSKSDSKRVLAELVPEVNNPEHAGLVNTLYSNALKKKGATSTDAAKAVRIALDALGIKGKGGSNRNSDPSQGANFKSGNEALNLFAPLK